MTLGIKRRLLHRLGITTFFSPFRGEFNARGLRRLCADPSEAAFDALAELIAENGPNYPNTPDGITDLAFVYGSLCLQDEYYVGNVSTVDEAPFPGLHNTDIGTNDAPSDNAFFWLLNGAKFRAAEIEKDLDRSCF